MTPPKSLLAMRDTIRTTATQLLTDRAVALVERIREWRDDDDAGYDRAINLLCQAEELLTALNGILEPQEVKIIHSSEPAPFKQLYEDPAWRARYDAEFAKAVAESKKKCIDCGLPMDDPRYDICDVCEDKMIAEENGTCPTKN